MTALNLPKLRELCDRFFADRDKRVFLDNDTVYFELLVDGKPTTVPQTIADVIDRARGPILAEALNAMPHLLAIAEAAIDACEVHHPSRGPTLPVDLAKLRAAIDAARKTT